MELANFDLYDIFKENIINCCLCIYLI
jgi:hypothetical protein